MSLVRCPRCETERDTDLVEYNFETDECEPCESKRIAQEERDHAWMRGLDPKMYRPTAEERAAWLRLK